MQDTFSFPWSRSMPLATLLLAATASVAILSAALLTIDGSGAGRQGFGVKHANTMLDCGTMPRDVSFGEAGGAICMIARALPER